jgi:hypothetical protein
MFSFTFTCHCNPFVILVLSFLQHPRALSFAPRIFLLPIPTQVRRKFDAWLELYFELIADQLEAVSLILLVPHAFVRFDAMGLPAMVFLAVGACVLLWLVVVVLRFLLFPARLGFIGFLVFTFAILAPFLR